MSTRDIERMIRNCATCFEFAPAKPKIKKKDMLHHEIPHTPWTKLATDIFYFQGINYLIIVDYTSKFPVVKQLRKIDQRAVITAFEEVFAERGYPDELVSDNGPCYRGEQFREFLKTKGIKHITSSPYYPQSNGLAEAYVKVVKNMMKKAQKCKVRFNDMMYQYRISPVAGKRESPIELLEQRRPRTNMPHLGKGNPRGDLKAKTHNYPIGITVMYRGGPDPDSTLHGTWYPARIMSHLEEPRSYLIENNYSKIVRRTEQHIRPYFTLQRPRPYHRRMMLEDCESPQTPSTTTGRQALGSKKRKQQVDGEFEADSWRKRNLRPTPPRIDAYTARRSLSPSPPDLYVTPDPEPRRSRQNPCKEKPQRHELIPHPRQKGDVPYRTETPIAPTNDLIDTFS